MILPLCYYGNVILRKKCHKIERITPDIHKLVSDMIETMDSSNGIGLAATQVGKDLCLFVIRPEIKDAEGNFSLGEPEVFINPVLSNPTEEREKMTEGCLSFPGLYLEIDRPYGIHVEALNLEGEKISLDIYGFKAREIMHENDHLNGKLFIDRTTDSVKNEIDPLLREIKNKYSKK